MANSGPHSNKSQFFITLAMNKSLDEKHSIFGEIISNEDLLMKINRQYVGKGEKPKHQITIEKIFCYDNPFRKAIKEIKVKVVPCLARLHVMFANIQLQEKQAQIPHSRVRPNREHEKQAAKSSRPLKSSSSQPVSGDGHMMQI